MTIFYSDLEHLSKYSPALLHLPPATKILNVNEDCDYNACFASRKTYICTMRVDVWDSIASINLCMVDLCSALLCILQSTGTPSTPYHCWYFRGNETADNCIIENMYFVFPENNHTSPIESLFSKTPYITMEIPIKLHSFLLIFLVFEPIAPQGIANSLCGGA